MGAGVVSGDRMWAVRGKQGEKGKLVRTVHSARQMAAEGATCGMQALLARVSGASRAFVWRRRVRFDWS